MADAFAGSLLERLINAYLEAHGSKVPVDTHFERRHRADWDVGWPAAVTAPMVGGGTGNGVRFLMTTIASKAAAANMSDKKAAESIIAAADNAIAQYLDSDDICPRWPYPGPPPPLVDMAAGLTLIANTLQPGILQTEVLKVAGLVLDRAQALAGGTAAPGKKGAAAAA